MKLNEYQKAAHEFAAYKLECKFKIGYPVLGLVEETHELLEADPSDQDSVVLEMGDVCWYCSDLALDLDLDLQDCYDNPTVQAIPDVQALYSNSARIAGRVKKILRGDEGREEKVLEVRGLIGDQLRRIEVLAGRWEIGLDEVFRRSIAKITARREANTMKGDGDHRGGLITDPAPMFPSEDQ